MKCWGWEYLRIIYRPEYTLHYNLELLRGGCLSTKLPLELPEFAPDLERLQPFVEREPQYRAHECTFAVLALESEPADPRPKSARAGMWQDRNLN